MKKAKKKKNQNISCVFDMSDYKFKKYTNPANGILDYC